MIIWYFCKISVPRSEGPPLKLAKSFDPYQPARNAQADMGRYFSQMHQAPLPISKSMAHNVLNI